MKKLLLSLLLPLFSCSTPNGGSVSQEKFEFLEERTVMVLNSAENSGGSGTIVLSEAETSYVITNAHVCGVVAHGGVISTVFGKYPVDFYAVATKHDLCVISFTAPDLGVNTHIADTAPTVGEPITISGHPLLKPHTVTSGNLTNGQTISMVTSMRPCNELDRQGHPLECMILGGMPIYTKYETSMTDALVYPGSSGSAVYNNDNEIVALVFAGNGRGISQAILVPWEYIVDFAKEDKVWKAPGEAALAPEGTTTEPDSLSQKRIFTPMVVDKKLDKLFNNIRRLNEKKIHD